MTEEELKKTLCPHRKDSRGVWLPCHGAACSQYREKDAPDARANRIYVPVEDAMPDANEWQFVEGNSFGRYYKRRKPVTLIDAWCGLAGTPHYAQV